MNIQVDDLLITKDHNLFQTSEVIDDLGDTKWMLREIVSGQYFELYESDINLYFIVPVD